MHSHEGCPREEPRESHGLGLWAATGRLFRRRRIDVEEAGGDEVPPPGQSRVSVRAVPNVICGIV